MMKRLFLPYELALIAKEKGFGYNCLACFTDEINPNMLFMNYLTAESLGYRYGYMKNSYCLAPLYQQVVDWFREVHFIHFYITPYGDGASWAVTNIGYTNVTDDGRLIDIHLSVFRKNSIAVKFGSYYEALNKAIEEAFKLI